MRLLVHLEDPGAVRFVAPFLRRLTEMGRGFVLVSSGVATRMLGEFSPRQIASTKDFAEQLSWASLVLVGTSENRRTIAFDIIRAARDANIPSIGAVDAFMNAEHRFAGETGNSLAYAPDWLMVPVDRVADAFAKLGFSRDQIFVVGHAAREGLKRSSMSKLPDTPKRVVFVSEVSTGLDPNQYRKSNAYSLHGRGGSNLRTQIVVEELLDAVSNLRFEGEKIEMVLRLHPKEGLYDLRSLTAEFDAVSSGGDPLKLLSSADLVIGMSSMLLSEAHAMGIPCLAIFPRKEEQDWLDETASGAIRSVTLREMIAPAIRELLTAPLPVLDLGGDKDSATERMSQALKVISAKGQFRARHDGS